MNNQDTRKQSSITKRARELRSCQTKSEGLLWSILRANQVCDLKFRRQHPVGPFFADFACVAQKLIVELDGAYHDRTAEADIERELFLTSQGWKVIRYTAEDVEEDPELVVIGISKQIGIPYEFTKRHGGPTGMIRDRGDNPPRAKGPTLPEGG